MSDDTTAEDIREMSYVDFLTFLDETNRPPGGKTAVRDLIRRANVRQHDRVLDVGCNTGFLSFELARVADCPVIGVDVSDRMVTRADERLKRGYAPADASVAFIRGDAMSLPFSTGSFDRVVCGGSTPFVADPLTALREYRRVVRNWGFVGELNFFYESEPPAALLEELSDRLGTTIDPWTLNDWYTMYAEAGFEVYDIATEPVEQVSDAKVAAYVDRMVEREAYDDTVRAAIRTRLTESMELFNRNHEYLQYGVFVLRKRSVPEQVSLFDSSVVRNQ